MKFIILIVLVLVAIIEGRNIVSVVANVRGRKFDLKASTVGEFMSQVEKLAGLAPGQQSVLFRGKLLGTNEDLSEAGVSNGDVLNVLKGRKTKLPHKPTAFKVKAASKSPTSSSSSKSSRVPSFPGFGGLPPGVNADQMKDAMARMEEMMNSGFLDEFFGDEEKMETARVNLKNNLDHYDKMIPGFRAQAEELVSSPENWREAMENAKRQVETFKKMRGKAGTGNNKTPTSDMPPPLSDSKGQEVEEPEDGEVNDD